MYNHQRTPVGPVSVALTEASRRPGRRVPTVPNYSSQNVVINRYFAALILNAIVDGDADPLVGATPKIRLSQDPAFNPQPNSTRAELAANEATFSGYTAGGYAPEFTPPVNLNQNAMGTIANVLPTAATATPFVGNVITGYWADDGTGVLIAERFANAITFDFAQAGDFLDLLVAIPVNLLQVVAV